MAGLMSGRGGARRVGSQEPPDSGLPADPRGSVLVERRGRSCAFWHLVALTVMVAALLGYLAWLDGEEPRTNGALRFLAVVLVALLIMTVLRWLGRRAIQPMRPPEPRPTTGPLERPALVVCCSGGGIKSASFCLGALQQLSYHRILQQASHLVGVSGGGYMAAAFSTLAWRRRQAAGNQPASDKPAPASDKPAPASAKSTKASAQPTKASAQPGGASAENAQASTQPGPFARGSEELNRLRRSTKYLTSSPEVRFELVASLLLGITYNLALLGCINIVLAWFLSRYAVDSGLLSAPTTGAWEWNSAEHGALRLLVWPSLLLLTVSFVWFLLVRRNPAPWSDERAKRRTRRPWVPVGQQRTRLEGTRGWQFAVGNLGARTSQMALLFVPVFPGVLWCAYKLEILRHWDVGSNVAALQLTAASLLTTLTTFLGLLRAARNGLRQDRSTAEQKGFVTWFQRQAAPVLAIVVFLIGLYASLVFFTWLTLRHFWGLDRYGWVFALGPIVVAACFKVNDTSIFQFYRDRLDAAYLSYQAAGGEPKPHTTPTLADLNRDTGPGTWPTLMLLGTANVRDPDMLPADRHGTPFVLSDRIGMSDPWLPGGTALVDAATYSYDLDIKWRTDRRRLLRVDTAVAISGAAVAPIAGRDDKVLGRYRLLLALANIRLGMWVRNPYWVMNDDKRTESTRNRRWARWVLRLNDYLDDWAPSLLFHEAIGLPRVIMPFLYVTDGGHYDNLGLVEALRQRPHRIIMLDGSGDPEDGFPTIANAIATARMDQQVEIDFDPRRLRRGARAYPRSGWTVCKATYPDQSTCDIVYIKALLPKGQSWDLESYRTRNPGFPATTMEYELFDEFTFEAYRELGCSLVRQAITELAWCKAPTSTTCQDDSHE